VVYALTDTGITGNTGPRRLPWIAGNPEVKGVTDSVDLQDGNEIGETSRATGFTGCIVDTGSASFAGATGFAGHVPLYPC